MLVHQMAAPNSPQWFNTVWPGLMASPDPPRVTISSIPPTEVKASDDAYTRLTPCVLHPERERLAGRTGGSHRSLGSRGAALQVRLGYRDELLRRPWRGRAAFGGGTSSGLMSFLGSRPRRGRDQVGRHDAPRREDGHPGHGPPGDRGFHQLEGPRGEEGAALIAAGYPSDFNGEAYAPSAARTRTTRSA